MQICEYYRQESNNFVRCFEGRWLWKIQREKTTSDSNPLEIECSDLFGKEENVTFTLKQSDLYVHELFPLNREFGLVSVTNSEVFGKSLRVIEFDWQRKEFFIGNENFDTIYYNVSWSILLDRSCTSNSDLDIIVYSAVNNLRKHCRVDVKNRRIIQNGSDFELPEKEFAYFGLNDGIITGLSQSLDIISRFDVRQQIMLDQIKVYGLKDARIVPKAFLTRNVSFYFTHLLLKAQFHGGCWTTDNQFIFQAVEKANVQRSNDCKLCCINLKSGGMSVLNYNFQHGIEDVCQSLDDGNLYVQSSESTGYRYLNKQRGSQYRGIDGLPPVYTYHFYRVPLNEPESLFFTAFKNVLKPLPDSVSKLALMRKDLPLNAYKCE